MKRLFYILGIVLFLAVSGCTDADVNPEMMENAPKIDSAHSVNVISPGMGGANAPTASGTVVETMDAAGYTYVQIDTGSGMVWAAGPLAVVEVNDSVNVYGNTMGGFTSPSLNRTFDEIIFSNIIEITSEPLMETPTISQIKENPESYYLVELSGTVTQTLDAVGYTYVELTDGSETVWVATYELNLSIGDPLKVSGTVNTDFTSPSLNRTFDVLILVPVVDSTATTGSGMTGGVVSPHGNIPVTGN